MRPGGHQLPRWMRAGPPAHRPASGGAAGTGGTDPGGGRLSPRHRPTATGTDRGTAIAVRGCHGESHPGGLWGGGDHRALQRRPGAGDRGSAKLPQCLRRRRPGRRHLHGGDPGRADLPWRHIPGDAGSHCGGYLPLCPGFCRRHGISPGRPGGASGHSDGGAAGGGVPHLRGARGDRLCLPGAAAGGASRADGSLSGFSHRCPGGADGGTAAGPGRYGI